MNSFEPYSMTADEMSKRVSSVMAKSISGEERKNILQFLAGIIDLTTLEGTDNLQKIDALVNKAVSGRIQAAAVCTYAVYTRKVKEMLKGTTVKTAAVAGGFPSGQLPLELKILEVQYAIDQGADEVDFTLNRGKLLEGRIDEVYEEIYVVGQLCRDVHLKVILETGELQSIANIRQASEIAINAGADFIKTSTGKVQPAATPEAVLVMMDTIREYFRKTRKQIGIKPSGGIADASTAIQYYLLVQEALGMDWMDKNYFRIGASRLFDNIMFELNGA